MQKTRKVARVSPVCSSFFDFGKHKEARFFPLEAIWNKKNAFSPFCTEASKSVEAFRTQRESEFFLRRQCREPACFFFSFPNSSPQYSPDHWPLFRAPPAAGTCWQRRSLLRGKWRQRRTFSGTAGGAARVDVGGGAGQAPPLAAERRPSSLELDFPEN